MNLLVKLVVLSAALLAGVVIFNKYNRTNDYQRTLLGHCKDKVYFNSWLVERKLVKFKSTLAKVGIENLLAFSSLESLFDLNPGDTKIITNESERLKNILVLQRWLKDRDRLDLITKMDLESLEDLKLYLKNPDLKPEDLKLRRQIMECLSLEKLKYDLWLSILKDNQSFTWMKVLWSLVIIFLLLWPLQYVLQQSYFPLHSIMKPGGAQKTKEVIFHYLTGRFLAPQKCKVIFECEDFYPVGETVGFMVKFYQRCGRPYPISEQDRLFVEIVQNNYKVIPSVTLGSVHPATSNTAKVTFTVRKSGCYKIIVMVQQQHVLGSPFTKTFIPGSPCKVKSGIVQPTSTVLAVTQTPFQQLIELRDSYNNLCPVPSDILDSVGYDMHVTECGTGNPLIPGVKFLLDQNQNRVVLVLQFESVGCYHVVISNDGTVIKNGKFDVIVLSEAEKFMVQKIVANKSQNKYFEARLLGHGTEILNKPKKVSIHLSPRQLTLKENIFKIIPISKRLYTFRLCPSTKFQFQGEDLGTGLSKFTIEDGCQPTLHLMSKDRNVIAATFTQFLLKNIGGSETFKDKQDFFYHEVRKLHSKAYHDKLSLLIDRDKIVTSSIKCTKAFGVAEWCRNFEITFQGEEGVDWGGLRREWFELLCSSLFGNDLGLFSRLTDSSQGLVHPNPNRPQDYKLKHYEFAGKIVGKCLYESALGGSYRQLVKAKFTRSFLGQLIGLRINHKYFEHDDPSLYLNKIKYILDSDVTDMDLYFVDEEMTPSGQLKTVDLIPSGCQTKVTNSNKVQYVELLAQYRLVTRVKDEVEYFLKGLTVLIPESLLSIFDENELELLLCGTTHFSITNLKEHHIVCGNSPEFNKVMDWFWTAVTNFSDEEMSRLLQFTTGCSQLPPGGFGELVPKFQLMPAASYGTLPTAHTCFNEICLPDYDSYQDFEKALLIAVNEGTEGFGLT